MLLLRASADPNRWKLTVLRECSTAQRPPYGAEAVYPRAAANADLAACKALANKQSSSCSPLQSTPLLLAQLYYREAVWSLTARSRLHQ